MSTGGDLSLCCQCNQISTSCECGEFDVPTVPDQGQGYPYRQKISCEAPVVPVAECADDTYVTTYDPTDVDHPFKVTAKLFDQLCAAITDQNGAIITLVIV